MANCGIEVKSSFLRKIVSFYTIILKCPAPFPNEFRKFVWIFHSRMRTIFIYWFWHSNLYHNFVPYCTLIPEFCTPPPPSRLPASKILLWKIQKNFRNSLGKGVRHMKMVVPNPLIHFSTFWAIFIRYSIFVFFSIQTTCITYTRLPWWAYTTWSINLCSAILTVSLEFRHSWRVTTTVVIFVKTNLITTLTFIRDWAYTEFVFVKTLFIVTIPVTFLTIYEYLIF